MPMCPCFRSCGSIDPIFGEYASAIEAIYQQFGGRISMMVKEGYAHHPHSLRNPKPIADFIEQSVQTVRGAAPAFAGGRFARTSYYSVENFYRDYPDEDTYITCRGPLFSPCYDRYEFSVRGTPMTDQCYRAQHRWRRGCPGCTARVLCFVTRRSIRRCWPRGFHIVTGPVGTNVDTPLVKDWDTAYDISDRARLFQEAGDGRRGRRRRRSLRVGHRKP